MSCRCASSLSRICSVEAGAPIPLIGKLWDKAVGLKPGSVPRSFNPVPKVLLLFLALIFQLTLSLAEIRAIFRLFDLCATWIWSPSGTSASFGSLPPHSQLSSLSHQSTSRTHTHRSQIVALCCIFYSLQHNVEERWAKMQRQSCNRPCRSTRFATTVSPTTCPGYVSVSFASSFGRVFSVFLSIIGSPLMKVVVLS